MRIFFIGTVSFSYECLKALVENNFNIVGVATRQDTGLNADYVDLIPFCIEQKIDFKHVKDINHPNNIKFIKEKNPDVIYCFGWSNLIKKDLLSLPPKGVVGFHPAKLPYNKGRHPIIWALCLGLKSTASTFFFMDEGADSGNIISQQEINISSDDSAHSLYQKITSVAIKQVLNFTPKIKNENIKGVKQENIGNSWRKRSKDDGMIDFRMSAIAIHNLVRSLTRPYIGAHLHYLGKEYKVWQVEISELGCINDEPGKVLKIVDGGFIIKVYDNSIFIKEHNMDCLPKVGEYL